MAINAYARALTDRLVLPVARGLARAGATPNGLTLVGLLLTVAGVTIILAGREFGGACVLALGGATDALDGAVARLRGESTRLGAFYDSVCDRLGEVVLLGAAAWVVRADPVTFVLAVVAFGGGQVTSYIRAKAESLGWSATVGILERPERVIIITLAFAFGFVPLALWVLAVGSVITVVQRMRCVIVQGRAA